MASQWKHKGGVRIDKWEKEPDPPVWPWVVGFIFVVLVIGSIVGGN